MNDSEDTPSNRGKLWKPFISCLVSLIILGAFVTGFYMIENARGLRAWESAKKEAIAKGINLNWNSFFPAPVTDEQNALKVPEMEQWFVRGEAQPGGRLFHFVHPATPTVGTASNAISSEASAGMYVAWSDQFSPELDIIRLAMQRPAIDRINHHTNLYHLPKANWVRVRGLVLMLAQRAHSLLLLDKPDEALKELTLLHELRRLFEAEPLTLVGAIISGASQDIYTQTCAEGLKNGLWKESHFLAIQEQLEKVSLLPLVRKSLESEVAGTSDIVQSLLENWDYKFADDLFGESLGKQRFIPEGWFYQNMASFVRAAARNLDTIPSGVTFVRPMDVERIQQELRDLKESNHPYTLLVKMGVPSLSKSVQATAYNQSSADRLFVACALERYRIAHGKYPHKLEELVPQFTTRIPVDVIDGGELQYRLTKDGYLLYSIGWNQMDNGGTSVLNSEGYVDRDKGDWVLEIKRGK